MSNFPHRRHCNFSYFCEKIDKNVEFKFCNPQKGTSLRETASCEPSCVKISSGVFPVEDGKKKGKERHKKSRKRYISPIRGEASRKRIFIKFCTSGDMLDVIICANFGVEKLKGLGNMRGQILEFPIEMAGHPYNRAGATAQLVMNQLACN